MIEIKNLTKKFDSNVALNRMNCSISEGTIFGLAGSIMEVERVRY